jgi:hypothetical protein
MTDQPRTIDINAIVDRYIQMRDMKAELKKQLDKKLEQLEIAMKKCEGAIMTHLNTHGAESIRTAAGTVFKAQQTSATVDDWDQLLAFIQQNEAWNMLDHKVNKTAVAEFMEANPGDLPPGVAWRAEHVVRVRRS